MKKLIMVVSRGNPKRALPRSRRVRTRKVAHLEPHTVLVTRPPTIRDVVGIPDGCSHTGGNLPTKKRAFQLRDHMVAKLAKASDNQVVAYQHWLEHNRWVIVQRKWVVVRP